MMQILRWPVSLLSQNVVITGDEDVTLSTATTNSVSSQGISAAGLTGNLTVTIAHTGNVANTASVTAGSGDDNIDIETGTGAITVDAGAGADTITLTSVGALATINANEGNDTIEMDEDTGAKLCSVALVMIPTTLGPKPE